MLHELAFLCRHGVPYETALRMSPARRFAWIVCIGEQEGGEFDWQKMRWKDRK